MTCGCKHGAMTPPCNCRYSPSHAQVWPHAQAGQHQGRRRRLLRVRGERQTSGLQSPMDVQREYQNLLAMRQKCLILSVSAKLKVSTWRISDQTSCNLERARIISRRRYCFHLRAPSFLPSFQRRVAFGRPIWDFIATWRPVGRSLSILPPLLARPF